jgi:hypothetical protein
MVDESSSGKGEFELKYTFPNIMSSSIASWLRFTCREDGEFPVSRVQSIYFETVDMRSLSEKINSDFFKTKYRLRWYEPSAGVQDAMTGSIRVFLEKKRKIGAQRAKERTIARAELDRLMTEPLDSSYHGEWEDQFQLACGGTLPRMFPLIQLSYIRTRFVDSQTGARLSLDYDIRVERTNPRYLQPALRQKLDLGVFEIKGDGATPPPSLHFITQHFARKTAFSKFERCVALVAL